MPSAQFDTLATTRELRAAGIEAAHAEAIVNAASRATDGLLTESRFEAAMAEQTAYLDKRLAEQTAYLEKSLAEQRASLETGLAEQRAYLEKRLGEQTAYLEKKPGRTNRRDCRAEKRNLSLPVASREHDHPGPELAVRPVGKLVAHVTAELKCSLTPTPSQACAHATRSRPHPRREGGIGDPGRRA